jgi:hypothetical protein
MASNPRYSMMDSMDVRCSRCGYENNPQFRFCGMCGAALRPRDPETFSKDQDAVRAQGGERKPERETDADIISRVLAPQAAPPPEPMPVEPLIAELTAAQKQQTEQLLRTYSLDSREESYPQESFHGERTPIPVSGPSFLGLSDNSEERRVEYLLEDEDHSGRAGKFVMVLFILAIAATGLFYWRKAGYPWPAHATNQAASSSPTTGTATPNEDNSAMPDEEPPPTAKAMIPAKPNTTPSPAATGEQPASASANPAPAVHPSETQNAEQEASTGERPEPKEQPESDEAIPPVSKPAPAMSANVAKPPKPRAATLPPPATPNPAEDSSFLEGQKYLYGTGGVAANCARASQYLTASANNNNSKAESTLATMYATGHCVRRDLPLAYRWFARALHEDPRNTRLERDVQIMWDQMSPQERNLALKNQ